MGRVFSALYGDDLQNAKRRAFLDDEESGDIPKSTVVDNSIYGYEDVVFASSKIKNARWWRNIGRIAVNLVVSLEKKKSKSHVIMFSGLARNVGNTAVAEGIANVLWQEHPDHRFLIISIREPVDNRDVSLVDLFGNDVAPADILSSISEGNVHKLYGGPPTRDNATHHLREFLIAAKSHFNWIIVDVPPFVESPINETIGRIADGIVIVANAGSTRVPTLNALTDEIENLGLNVLGLILNRRKYPLPKWLLRYL